jgi:excisionase family DNA binding protein
MVMFSAKGGGEFLGARELQAWLGISKPTLLAWLRRARNPLPGVKIGGRWKFRRQAILEWWIREENAQTAANSAGPGSRVQRATERKDTPQQELDSWLRIASRMLSEEERREAKKARDAS